MGVRTDLCQSRQVNQCKVQHMGGEDFQIDGLSSDALVIAGDPRGFILDFPLDIAKVGESPVGNMMKLGPLAAGSGGGIPVASGGTVLGIILWDIDELEDEWPPCDDTAAAGEKIATDDVFEDRGLAS